MALYNLKYKKVEETIYVFDNIRKKYVVNTPEENVRQNLLQFLVEKCSYPKACISVEKKILVNNKKLRYDIVVYNSDKPWMLIECKAPDKIISEDTFYQSIAYQNSVLAKYILLTNGINTLCYDTTYNKWIDEIVPYGTGA